MVRRRRPTAPPPGSGDEASAEEVEAAEGEAAEVQADLTAVESAEAAAVVEEGAGS